ncbi:MAG: aminotransferase class I/II-fold pyridoxal phosphate-dependent enzyme [Actinomycetota bacterium]
MSRIFLSAPDIRGWEVPDVTAALESGWLAPAGPELERFESEISKIVDGRHCVALSSGTAALHLALLGVGVRPGDEVICSTLTFAASANAIVHAGANPVFVDAEERSWNLDPDLLADELTWRARAGNLPAAVLTVDLYGQCCDYDRIAPLCAEYGVPVVEDAAEALGATYRDRPAGAFGAVAAFSFNGNKIITASGGGMLVTGDADLADRARYLATQARQPAAHYEHTEVGFNYRLSNVLAALGRAQLRDLDARVDRRRELNRRYRHLLAEVPGVTFMPEADGCRSTFWLTCLTIDPERADGIDRDRVRLALEGDDIEARPVWKPMHRQPVYTTAPALLNGVADRLFERGLCLPSGSGMGDDEVERVFDSLRLVFDLSG